MSKILKNIKIIFVFFLVNSFLLNLAFSNISNYSANVYILKLVSSTILFFLIFADIRISKLDIRNILKENNPKKLVIILILFLGYLSFTLIYSHNPGYGLQKILNFLISTIPSIIAFYYFVITNSKEHFGIFIFSIVVITIISVTYIIFNYPFEQATIYEYRSGRWSHVIYGRMIGSIAVVLFLYLMWMLERHKTKKEIWKVLFFIIVTSIAAYGLYLSALRSAMLGLVVLVVLGAAFLVYELTVRSEKRTARRYQLAGIAAVIIFTLSFIIVIPKPEIIESRFDNLTEIEDFEFGGDEPINTRMEALRISKKIILEHPVFGVGFGGFRSYNDFTEVVKYPHNIFVEMAVEGGVAGVLVLCALFLVLFKAVFRFSSYVLLFTFFALSLAMFSKELSNQSLLWIFIAFTGLRVRSS